MLILFREFFIICVEFIKTRIVFKKKICFNVGVVFKVKVDFTMSTNKNFHQS